MTDYIQHAVSCAIAEGTAMAHIHDCMLVCIVLLRLLSILCSDLQCLRIQYNTDHTTLRYT
jgi:hypothetical protein